MRNSKYLQKMFFLLVMGFSLSCVCVACGDDDDDEPFTEEQGGGSTDNSGSGDVTIPNDSVPSGGGEEFPQDSLSGGDEPLVPADSIIIQGHAAVDLGLPSGLKWATCNVGADSPEEYGDYFAWGETTAKSSYYGSNSITSNLPYSELKSRGIIGSNRNLTASYDAATANLGGSWRMPTLDEMKELINECTWEWTTYNGVNGRLVIGSNGNSIFLPAAGHWIGTDFICKAGFYWSATPLYDSSGAHYLNFTSGGYDCYWGSNSRSYGRAVRPVSE